MFIVLPLQSPGPVVSPSPPRRPALQVQWMELQLHPGLVFSVDNQRGRKPHYRQEEGHFSNAYDPSDVLTAHLNKTSVQFIYPNFVPKSPTFLSTKDKLTFESQFPAVNITSRSAVHVIGHGCVGNSHGGHATAPVHTHPRARVHDDSTEVLFPVLSPTQCSLHDVVHSAIPAIVQGAEYITDHNASLVIPSHCDQLSKSILESIKLNSNPVKYFEDSECPAKIVIQTQNARVASPELWQKARKVLDISASPRDDGQVILITQGTMGGKAISLADGLRVEASLRHIFGSKLEVISHPLINALDARRTFEKAAVVIGVPFDQMDLMIFAPPGTAIVEFLPYGEVTRRSSWHLAAALGHRYVVGYEDKPAMEDTFFVNPDRVVTALRRLGYIDNRNRQKAPPNKGKLPGKMKSMRT